MTGQYSIRNGLSLIIVPGSPSTLSQSAVTTEPLHPLEAARSVDRHDFAPQPILAPVGPAKTGHEVVAIDTASRFQRMQGFGAAMTDASAELFLGSRRTNAERSWRNCSAARTEASAYRSPG